MAGNGPAPKPDAARRGHSKPTYGHERTVQADGTLRGPEPEPEWPEAVRLWWATWRAAPQAALFEETDWLRLRMIAPLVARAFEGSAAAMTEVRLNESLLGATVTDRLKARIRVEREEPDRPLATVYDARAAIAARLTPKDTE